MTTLETVQSVLRKNLGPAADTVEPGTTLEALAVDSLALIEVMFDIETELKITIPTDASATQSQLKTVGDLVAYIDTLVADSGQHQSPGQVAA
jgi:acyl carrier protein